MPATSDTARSEDFAIVSRSGRLEGSMIEYLVDDGVATVTINDPARRNPLSNDVIGQLKNAVIRAGDDDAVAVVVITGAGDRAFSAGGDLASGFVDSPLPGHSARGELADLFRAMTSLPKPVVGRVNGAALGGGFGVAAACDITVVVETAKMGTPEISLGLWPMMISAVLFPLVPRKTLMWMMMTGAVITGERAAELGIATLSVPGSDLDDVVDGIVAKLKRAPSGAMALGKRSFYATASMDPDTALDHLHIGLTAVSFTDDAAEGVSAFLERRDPEWTGR
jgi:enoyl-CoA hydratase/carnithine racemase